MESIFDILFVRRPVLNYVCPPVCEVLFSGTGVPIIILEPFTPNSSVSGLVRGGAGGFRLSWNRYPGAICYSVYQADNEDEPFGTYHLIAECIPDATFELPPGRGPFRVTAITPDGETPPSDPIYGGGDGAPVVTVLATEPSTGCDQAPGVFTFSRTQPLTNPLIVKYIVTGTADPDVDYSALSGEAIIPAGLTFVDVDVFPLDSGLTSAKTVVVTIIPNVNDEYIIGTPDSAIVNVGACVDCATPGFWNLGSSANRSGGLAQFGGKTINVDSNTNELNYFDGTNLIAPLNVYRLASDFGLGASQAGDVVKVNGSFFVPDDVNRFVHWVLLDVRYKVIAYISPTQVQVDTSNTIGVDKDSSTSGITATQALDVVTTSANFFDPADVGAVLTWQGTSDAYSIIAYISPTQVQVDTSNTEAVQSIVVQSLVDMDVSAYSIGGSILNARVNDSGDIVVNQNSTAVLFKNEDEGLPTILASTGVRRLNKAGNTLGTNSRYYYRDGTNVALGILPSFFASGQAQRDQASILSQDSDRVLEFQRDATIGQFLRVWNNGVLANVNPTPLPPPPSFPANHQFVTGHAMSPNGTCVVSCVGFSPTFSTGLYWYITSVSGATLASFPFVEGDGQINGCHGVNDSGQCALYIKDSTHNVPGLGNSNGTITLIPLLSGRTNGESSFISSNGVVVGFQNDGVNDTAFFYKNGITHDLNDYVPQSFKDLGWVLTTADMISDDGYIYGRGKISGVDATYLICHSDFV